jgi:O-antigen ligase
MNAPGRSISGPILLMGGLAYFLVLAVALVWWHMPPLTVLGLTLGAIALVTLALRPYLGVQVFVMILFVEFAAPTDENLTITKLTGAIVLASWLLSIASRRGAGLRFNGLTAVMLLFLAWTGVTVLYAFDAQTSLSRLFTVAQLVALTLMVHSVVDRPARLRGVYWGFVLWAWAATIVAIAEYYLGMTKIAVGLMGDRNLLACYIDIAVACAYLLYESASNPLAKLFLASTLPVFFVGLALTLSRSGLIVLLVALVFIWYRVIRERRFILLVGSLALLCAISGLLPEVFWSRVRTIVPAIERQEDTFGLRVSLWRVGLRMIEDRPLTGVGAGNYLAAFPRYSHGELLARHLVVHNTYIDVAAEEGLVGLGLFLLLLGLAVRATQKAIRVARQKRWLELELLAVANEGCLIICMAGGIAGNSEVLKILWVAVGISMSLERMAAGAAPEAKAVGVLATAPGFPQGGGTWTVAR